MPAHRPIPVQPPSQKTQPVHSVHVLRAAARSSPLPTASRRGVPMSLLTQRAREVAAASSDHGVVDHARLCRDAARLISNPERSPAERTVLIDALLRALGREDAAHLAVSLTHLMFGSALGATGRGAAVVLLAHCEGAPEELAWGACRQLQRHLDARPGPRVLETDGLVVVTDGLNFAEVGAMWRRLLDSTQRLRGTGALRDVVMVVRPPDEAWSDDAVLERELELSLSSSTSPEARKFRDAQLRRNLLYTDLAWKVTTLKDAPPQDLALAVIAAVRALLPSAAGLRRRTVHAYGRWVGVPAPSTT